ncbi:MAG: hypothetical protein DRJ09_12125 [Bacteroidetes bacterium]|nr:MAG: hypothetical protein DRJ09_12125 [Bacteroidota bacterium]
MKYFYILVLSLFGLQSMASSQWVEVTSSTPTKPVTTLESSNISESVINVTVNGFWKSEVSTPRGNAWLIDLGNHVRNLEKGSPDLPYISTSLIIPDLSKMKVEVVSSQYREFQNVLIAPSKGNLYRDIDPAGVPYEYGTVYQNNGNYPENLAKLNEPYIVRDYRGEAVWIYPFQYNPVTKTLRVYYNIKVKVSEAGIAEINPLNRTAPLTNIDSRFNNIYKTHFLNYNASRDYTPVDEHGNMLIISYGDFMDEMNPFITWKMQSGTPVEIVDVATIGNAAAIKQYVADYYNNKGLTFLLLVGDAAQVPSSVVSGNDSDNDYTYVVGNDHYPDLFCGRFSAETEEQVTTQVNRMVDYEKNPEMSDTTWFTQSLGIGSDQGPGDDNEYDWEHIRNIQENKLLPYTYVYDYELYDGSQGGNDAPGNPGPSDVSTAVNDGVTIINYCGHGSNTSWGTTGFNNSNVNNLTNAGHLPFIFSVACVNGNFVNHTCFAEAWMRAEDSFGNPTGAISTIMSTINQSWNPPMCGQDAMDDILVETYPDNIKRTFGGVTMNGCMEMNDTYGSGGYEMTDTWTIFGDPSLMLRTAVPQNLAVIHPATLSIGDMTMTISCPIEGALATLSMGNEILGSATVSGGSATLVFYPGLDSIGDASLVVIAYNHIPSIDTIPIISSDGPYISYAYNTLNDSLGNNNQMADYTEDILLTAFLTNNGNEDAVDVIANISTSSPYLTLTDTTENYGTITVDDTVGIYNGYRFTLADSVPDMTPLVFSMEAQDTSGQTYNMMFMVTAHAPNLQYLSYKVIDTTGNGNGNGKLDPGETAGLNVYLANTGSSEAYNVTGLLSGDGNWISIANNSMNYGNMAAGDTTMATYTITADGDTPLGYDAIFTMNISADYGISATGQFSMVVGQRPIMIVKLAPTLSEDSLMTCLEELSISADTTHQIPENLSNYQAVFVLLGTFSDNHILTNDEGQMLADYLNSGGKLYMEGGDTWAYNDPTPVHPMFFIDGLDDGSGDLYNVIGTDGSFMQGFSFEFQGSNNYIDHIAPIDNAFTILSNSNASYDVTVAYADSVYRTVGSSFEFGGLMDNAYCNKSGYLAEILSFFGVTYIWTDVQVNTIREMGINAYPNPFNSIVHFKVATENSRPVRLQIYDMTGKLIFTQTATSTHGTTMLQWDAAGDVKPGIYFYQITAGNKQSTGKVVLNK